MLDLVFISSDLRVSIAECVFPISPPPNIHHSPLSISVQFSEYLNEFRQKDFQYNYNSAYFDLINTLFTNVDWSCVLDSKIVSYCYDKFLKEVNTIFKIIFLLLSLKFRNFHGTLEI